MFNSAIRFAAALVVTFVLLTYMWVSAAQADTGCRKLSSGVTMCDGAAWQLPEAPRGTARRLNAPSVRHIVAAALAAHNRAAGGRVGTTEIVARLGR